MNMEAFVEILDEQIQLVAEVGSSASFLNYLSERSEDFGSLYYIEGTYNSELLFQRFYLNNNHRTWTGIPEWYNSHIMFEEFQASIKSIYNDQVLLPVLIKNDIERINEALLIIWKSFCRNLHVFPDYSKNRVWSKIGKLRVIMESPTESDSRQVHDLVSVPTPLYHQLTSWIKMIKGLGYIDTFYSVSDSIFPHQLNGKIVVEAFLSRADSFSRSASDGDYPDLSRTDHFIGWVLYVSFLLSFAQPFGNPDVGRRTPENTPTQSALNGFFMYAESDANGLRPNNQSGYFATFLIYCFVKVGIYRTDIDPGCANRWRSR